MTDHIAAVGRVATAPKRIDTGGGRPFSSFRLASNNRRLDPKTGTWVDSSTSWYTVNAWAELAENSIASLKIGEQVVVRGRLEQRTWRTEEGVERLEVAIAADAIGHDLKRGTSAFTPVFGPGGVARSAPTQHADSSNSTGDGGDGSRADDGAGQQDWVAAGAADNLPF
jgi:single-strand DNA-binding protein